YIEGACEVRLPAGDPAVLGSKKTEYTPAQRAVAPTAGQPAPCECTKRPGDRRVPGVYTSSSRAPPHSPPVTDLASPAGRPGLVLVHLLARERPASADRPGSTAELLEFSGNQPALSSGDCLALVNTLNVHPRLGSVALLPSHRPVFPLRSGEPGPDDWSVLDW